MTPALFGATFVVPQDRPFIHRADAIIVASALTSYPVKNDDGRIETVTPMSIEEAIRGPIKGDSIDVREPGGTLDERATVIPGVPRFHDGERYLLFLMKSEHGWRVLDLVLGKFTFVTDASGRHLLVRDEAEIAGWDTDGSPHRPQLRSAPEFLTFVRTEARGGVGKRDYFVDSAEPVTVTPETTTSSTTTSQTGPPNASVAVNATYTATSYTFTISGSLGGRWNVFPNAVSFFSVGSEPGAPGGGTTAINAAIAAWDNDPNSNVNYVYAGADTSGTHTKGISAPDGENTIMFERNLSAYGVSAFQCSSNSYGGTLGLGGITNASGTHVAPNGETFATTLEGDVEMNQGIANCTLLFNNGDFNSAVTHEVGHTLGFRHSDQTRADDPSIACSTDPSLECSTNAIMKSFITTGLNATLQAWDQHAVDSVYPGTGGGTTVPTTPTGINARATSTTTVLVTWNGVSGATSYQVYRKSAGTGYGLIANVSTNSFTDNSASPNSAYLYEVRATNSAGSSPNSGPDLATTVMFTDDPLTAGAILKAVYITELRTAVNAVRRLAGLSDATFTDAMGPGVIVKGIHIIEIRQALDQAMIALGLTSGGWTNSDLAGGIIRAVHIQEIRNRVK